MDSQPGPTLANALRDQLGRTPLGCEYEVCGACIALFECEAVRSCVWLAPPARGNAITEVNGIAGMATD
jgi:carbon-monoxide dehydrogenase small subunit